MSAILDHFRGNGDLNFRIKYYVHYFIALDVLEDSVPLALVVQRRWLELEKSVAWGSIEIIRIYRLRIPHGVVCIPRLTWG